jgi:hypothetical protein
MVRMRLGVLSMLLLLPLMMEILVVRPSLLVEVHWRRELLRGRFDHMCSSLVKNKIDLIFENGYVRGYWVVDRLWRYWAQDVELTRILGCFFRCHVCEMRYAPTCYNRTAKAAGGINGLEMMGRDKKYKATMKRRELR